MDQRIINLYDNFTHGGMSRRDFFDRLAKLAGSMKANLSKAAGLFGAPASQVARLAAALLDKRQAEAPADEPTEAPADEAPAEEAAEPTEAPVES